MDDQLIPFVIDIIKIITYIFGLIIVMGNVFNVNITALATGLGIGGIAIAMASKESLENLLGSFTIFFRSTFYSWRYSDSWNNYWNRRKSWV